MLLHVYVGVIFLQDVGKGVLFHEKFNAEKLFPLNMYEMIFELSSCYQKCLQILQGYSEAVNQKTDNTMIIFLSEFYKFQLSTNYMRITCILIYSYMSFPLLLLEGIPFCPSHRK